MKRAHRFLVIESIDQVQPLIEKPLCAGAIGRYPVMDFAESRHQNSLTAPGMRMILCAEPGSQQWKQERVAEFHLFDFTALCYSFPV